MIAFTMLVRNGTLWVSAFICSAVLGGFLTWASMAPLAEGVIAYGQISVENNRKTIQHLEGGIIQEVLVVEGQSVESGQPLIVLTDIVVAAGRDQILYELANAIGSVDRLEALSEGADDVGFRQLSAMQVIPSTMAADVKMRQSALFSQQQNSLNADLSVLKARIASFESQVLALGVQLENNRSALEFQDSELERNERLLETQLIRASEISTLEREKMRLQSDQSRLLAEQALAQSRIGEIKNEIDQRRASYAESVGRELVEARRQGVSLMEQLEAAQDAVNRTIIEAPQSGEILNLNFTTPGGVVRSGEPILEIVPQNTDLIAVVKVRPVDRETVFEGLVVDARLTSTSSWHAALYEGTIEGISADLKMAPDGSESYYEARVSLNTLKSTHATVEPMPGMPVEAFVYSGRERTFFEYVTEPLLAAVRRGGRE